MMTTGKPPLDGDVQQRVIETPNRVQPVAAGRSGARQTRRLCTCRSIEPHPAARRAPLRRRATAAASSASASTGCAPGRVDSAPISRMSAPAASRRRARASASAASAQPSPENESGVTLTMPITYVRSPHANRRARVEQRRSRRPLSASVMRRPVASHQSRSVPTTKRRAGHDDDRRGLGLPARERKRFDRIGDHARRARRHSAAMLASRCGRSATRPGVSNDVNVKDAGSAHNGSRMPTTSLVCAIATTKREAPPGKRFGQRCSERRGFVGVVRDVEDDVGKSREEFHAARDDEPRQAALRRLRAAGRSVAGSRSSAAMAVAAFRC